MTEQELTSKSVFDVFASQQETFEEAQRKNSEESRKRAQYLRLNQDGTYSIRILPLAPVIDADGNALPMDRKGYEYPLRSQLLKIENESKLDKRGNPTVQYVTVIQARQAYKDLQEDLIDTYVRVACDKYASDEALCKKLRAGSFEGGLKWNNQRCMYVYNMDERSAGIQILQLSYAQYRELEERKLSVWNKLLKKNSKQSCPISSIADAFPVEVVRKTEGKTSYSFNVDTLSDTDSLSEEELKALLDAPRLPEALYRYDRYHLEATIVFLNQLDKRFDIDVMGTTEVKECIETIKMLLPSDDTSHFTIGGGDSSGSGSSVDDELDKLWARLDEIDDDKSDEGAELRADLREFIEENELNVKITRSKSNEQVLKEIEQALGSSEDEDEDDESAAAKEEKEPEQSTSDDEDVSDEPVSPQAEDGEDDGPAAPSRHRERNDDTNEPAARPERDRRSVRPHRRR